MLIIAFSKCSGNDKINEVWQKNIHAWNGYPIMTICAKNDHQWVAEDKSTLNLEGIKEFPSSPP